MTPLVQVLYLIAFSLFIYGLMGLTGPRTAVRGNLIAAVGMGIAVVATLHIPGVSNWVLVALGVVIASLFGAVVGSVSFWGSLVAFGKLQALVPGRPMSLGKPQQLINGLVLLA